MRRFAWTLSALCALTIGCNKPVETIPAVTPEPITSGTTLDEAAHDHDHDGDHDHADHDHAEGAGHDEDKGVDAVDSVDEDAVDSVDAVEEVTEGEGAEPSAANAKPEMIRFVADKRIAVPSMMCPYSCWPKVKETLAAQPGVEAVQLAEQPAGTSEGEIKERVVELKLNGNFDADAAIAALEKVSFKAELAN